MQKKQKYQKEFIKLIATGLYAGYFPFASGTFGTLVGIILFLIISRFSSGLYLVLVVSLFLVGVGVSTQAEIIFGQKDSGYIVIDEIVGFLVTMMFVPNKIGYILVGFFFFRLFDVLKPYPARAMEKINGGFGIMLDDVFAGFYAFLVLQLIQKI
ncbi:MAG: phosphatidylglycerophosphatase A [bacterium]